MQEKQCARCSRLLPLTDFKWLYRHDRGKDERFRDAWCQPCRRAYKRLPAQLEKAAARTWIKKELDPALKEQSRLRSSAYYKAHKELVLAKMRTKGAAGGWLHNRLRKKFGIGLDEYYAMHEAQGGKCKLCGREEMTRQRRLAVDHCHTTGKVRGLLCHHCNTGLGNFNDSVELLHKAVAYLRETGA